jgi:hypothetical protein
MTCATDFFLRYNVFCRFSFTEVIWLACRAQFWKVEFQIIPAYDKTVLPFEEMFIVGFKGVLYHLWSIYSNNSHVGYLAWSSDTILKIDTIRMIQTNFGSNWPCSFKEDDFENSLHQTCRAQFWKVEFQIIPAYDKTVLPFEEMFIFSNNSQLNRWKARAVRQLVLEKNMFNDTCICVYVFVTQINL